MLKKEKKNLISVSWCHMYSSPVNKNNKNLHSGRYWSGQIRNFRRHLCRNAAAGQPELCCGYVAAVARRLLLLSLLDVSLSITVHDCVCGFVEGSIARAHGLPWGCLKAACLFAYQIYCGSKKKKHADLHYRKPSDFTATGPRWEWERRVAWGGGCWMHVCF